MCDCISIVLSSDLVCHLFPGQLGCSGGINLSVPAHRKAAARARFQVLQVTAAFLEACRGEQASKQVVLSNEHMVEVFFCLGCLMHKVVSNHTC